MNVVEFLHGTYTGEEFEVRPLVECADGFTISIQGGTRGHYCRPRKACDIYNQVELGYPSEPDELITPFAESKHILCDTVYPYVPIEIVEKLIEKHGGILDIVGKK